MSNKMKSTIDWVNVADGFTDDCKKLIRKYLKADKLDYNVFCNIWKDMKFAYIFHGRSSGAEVAELSEEVIHIAKQFMFDEGNSFEESVAGLFTVYSLLHLQPYPDFAHLRLTPKDLDTIYFIEDMARKQKRLDVLYILGSLLIEGPVQYHIADREYGLEKQIKRRFQGTLSIDKVELNQSGVLGEQNEMSLLKDLTNLGRQYRKAKALISGGDTPDRTLNYVDEHTTAALAASLKKLTSKDGAMDNGEEAASDRQETAAEIKQRAMVDTVNRMKHLISISERPKRKKRRGKVKPDLKSTPGKIKSGSPKKQVPTSSPTKKSTPIKKKARKRKPIIETSESSDEELEICFDDSDIDILSEEDSDSEDTEALENCLTEIQEEEKSINDNVTEIATNSNAIYCVQSIDDGSRLIEIEIIDEADTLNETPDNSTVETELKTDIEGTKVIAPTEEIAVNSESDKKQTTKGKSRPSTLSKKSKKDNANTNEDSLKTDDNNKTNSHLLKKRSRKELKRSVLKSTLKRLGTIQVADMADD